LGDRHGISLALGCSPTLSELISLCLIVNGEKFVTLTDLAYSEVERFAVIVLNIKHRAIAKEVISVGSKTECIANPGEIFRTVLKHNGTRCIVAHNHPSGSIEPSLSDISLTRSLLSAGQTLGIPVLDHLILSGEVWYSFRQQTQLWQDIAQGD
jgi:DNA repair protein RadC